MWAWSLRNKRLSDLLGVSIVDGGPLFAAANLSPSLCIMNVGPSE